MQRKDPLKHVIITLPVQVVGALLFQWSTMWSRILSDSIANMYSREAELASDIYAVDFVYEHLWHVGCIMDFFQKDIEEGAEFMTRWSSHPLSSKRINRVAEYITEQWYPEKGCTPLPALGSVEE
jgi:Zn-dependent protease with chaperone function